MIMTLLTHFAATNQCKPLFFGLRPWYYYLEQDANCNIINFTVLDAEGSDFLLIALALVDDLLRIAAFVAVGYIIYGGILYMTSQGAPDQAGKAQSTIQNALIGLVIAVASISLVGFVGNRIG